jgi:two-component system LytT family sensor kinase
VRAFKINTDSLLPPTFKNSRGLIFMIHWMAWLLLHFITFFPAVFITSSFVWKHFLYVHIVLVTLNFLLFYVVAFLIAPLMGPLKEKWIWVVIGSLLLAIVFTYFKFRFEHFSESYLKNIGRHDNAGITSGDQVGFSSASFASYFQFTILHNVSIVIVGFAYRLLLLWFQQEKIKTNLENQKLEAELSFLKMQVNPHFLFNVLNNIYSLAVSEKSTKTGNSILKLSELMRYMLYEKEDAENKVSLAKEIHQINSYIDLEKLRHAGEVYLNFSIEGNINGKRIAPLLLFPLIENAFKHAVLNDLSKPVNIELKLSDQRMKFCISNFKNDYPKDKNGGIGIENVRKRLELLYKNEYGFTIENSRERFIVNLSLPL